MRFIGWSGVASPVQRLKHAVLHFARRLAGKRHGQNLLRTLDVSQQFQIALDEQFGFAGARGSLHDK